MRWLVASLWISLIAGCNEETSTGAPAAGSGGGSAPAKPAGGGFSAELAKEFASATGSGSAKAGSGEPAGKPATGDGKAGSGEAVAKAGSGEPAGKPPEAGSGEPAGKAGSGEPAGKAGSGEAVAKAGSGDARPAGTGTEPAPKAPPEPGPVVQGNGATPRKVTVPADLAAIKFGMLPNWERDVQDAGTLSLAVKVPGRSESAVFVFRYGYEDAGAPADRDAYKKWLASKRLLTVRQDRQAGAAWFLEGADGSGKPAFRVVVNWGGRKLICYGSLYRDAASSRLGDLRDQTILQAKQICETIAL